MNIRKRLATAIHDDMRDNGINLDGLATLAHRVVMDMGTQLNELQEKSARRGKKISDIQTLIMKKPFTERTAIEQRVLDIIFDNVYSD